MSHYSYSLMHRDLEAFLEDLRLTGRGSLTVRRYRAVLCDLDTFAGGAAPAELSKEALLSFMRAPCKRGVSRAPAGVKLRRAVLRGAFAYLHGEGLIIANPAARLPSVRLPRRPAKGLTDHEILEVVDHVRRRSGRTRMRDLGILLVFWQTGFRVSELAALRRPQFELRRRCLSGVHIKGGHVVDVQLNDEAVDVLSGLLAASTGQHDGPIFTREDGGPLSVRAIEARFEVWKSELGWTRPLHPHVLRHTHATEQRTDGAQLETIADSLNHSDLNTVKTYAPIRDPKLEAALALLGARIPRKILNEFRKLRQDATESPKSTCVEPSFYEPGEAA